MNTIIIGAGGHAKVVCSILDHSHPDLDIVAFVDSVKLTPDETIFDRPIWQFNDLIRLKDDGIAEAGIVGIGDNEVRKQRFQQLLDCGFIIPSAIHGSAQINYYAEIGIGSVIAMGAIIGLSVKIGGNSIINTGAIIDHDTNVGSHCHIAPGTKIAGGVQIGDGTFIGIGSVVKDRVRIGNHVTIGAGTVVIDHVPDHCTVVGVPGRIIKSRE